MKLYCLFLCLCFSLAAKAQEMIDTAVLVRIRTEELTHSQIPTIAHELLELPGPRLTNSPGYRRAGEWVISTLKNWGLNGAGFEAWGMFGSGWELEHFDMAISKPYYQPIIGYPWAWTQGTNGPTTAGIFPLLRANLNPTYINDHKAEIRNKFLLLGDSVSLNPSDVAFSTRLSDRELDSLKDFYMFSPEQEKQGLAFSRTIDTLFWDLQDAGALGAIEKYKTPGGRDGTVFVMGTNEFKPGFRKGLPEISVTVEDFNKIRRMVLNKDSIQVELNVKTRFISDDLKGYNVVAELPGSDPVLKDQIVMIGAHLDSWQAATGATDNGAGCIVMLEVMRLLKVLDLHPKRTIRIALWSGEEQGLLGSTNYVKNHFGDQTTMKLLPAQKQISVYYNLDNGSGKIRGVWAQGDTAVKSLFEQWLAPLRDLGVSKVTLHSTGSTDHVPFDAVGIPAFQFIQDPLEYETRTHHTNMDTYDHLNIPDLQQAAIVVASFVYNSATRSAMMPRKPLPAATETPFVNQ
jgi:carboxypeptidase Q